MKKNLVLFAYLILISFGAFAQTVTFPNMKESDSHTTVIAKVETGKQYTVITFDQYALQDSFWMVLNKEIYLQTDAGNKHYNFVKAEGIAVVPEKKTIIAKAGGNAIFKVYFEKIPANSTSIDIIEHAGRRGDGITFFNFYGVDLTHSNAGEQQIKITEVVLAPPPINENGDMGDMASMMNSMGPMYNSLTKAVMDAQLNFYKQQGKLAELASLHRQYYTALVKEGFTEDQALKIITSAPLVQIMAPQTK